MDWMPSELRSLLERLIPAPLGVLRRFLSHSHPSSIPSVRVPRVVLISFANHHSAQIHENGSVQEQQTQEAGSDQHKCHNPTIQTGRNSVTCRDATVTLSARPAIMDAAAHTTIFERVGEVELVVLGHEATPGMEDGVFMLVRCEECTLVASDNLATFGSARDVPRVVAEKFEVAVVVGCRGRLGVHVHVEMVVQRA
ncbi:hypothetical protein BKA62DRAFT_54796 [Auriculariales sp. MPI-PUGE-AT-0066]|nr:hypothetical protein BKA62DRAFT_54796 [Auriculariales sp. MPI-PUGE-AT-0066]